MRNHPVRWASLALLLALFLLPVWPYRPYCGNPGIPSEFGTLEGELTPDFAAAIDMTLWDERLVHLRFGDQIYVPLPSALAPFGELDLGRSVYGAQLQAVNRLVRPHYVGTFIGERLNGRVYRLPGYLRVFLDEKGRPDAYDCTFVRAVAFGEPPPPGYAPEPSFLDRPPKTSP
jgi:hypothetical protein